jgi:hypothetical protein
VACSGYGGGGEQRKRDLWVGGGGRERQPDGGMAAWSYKTCWLAGAYALHIGNTFSTHLKSQTNLNKNIIYTSYMLTKLFKENLTF